MAASRSRFRATARTSISARVGTRTGIRLSGLWWEARHMTSSRLTLVCWLLFTIVVAACAPKHGISAGARIAVGGDDLADEGPFRVVYAGPRGEVASASEITIAFSRAVR